MWKKRPQPAVSKRLEIATHRGRWHAVSVISDRFCCEAVRGVIARRFLAAEAPRLPLLGCSAPQSCTCKYKHHGDRRGPPRRKEDISGLVRRDPKGAERRVGKCRRLNDLDENAI